jgi:cell division protein FtsB
VTRTTRVIRLAGRLALLGVALAVVAVVAVQFAGIVAKNIAVAGELSKAHAQIQALQARQAQQRRTIVRLSDPAGAIPEIHNELHMVGPNEEIIYVRGASQPADSARHWTESP